jgi:uncharacterized protein HemY
LNYNVLIIIIIIIIIIIVIIEKTSHELNLKNKIENYKIFNKEQRKKIKNKKGIKLKSLLSLKKQKL